jgi:nonsense-mediated mRNA decay protein 3
MSLQDTMLMATAGDDDESAPAEAGTMPKVACVSCGIPIQYNPTMMCVNCLRVKVDITSGLSTEMVCFHCTATNQWMFAGGEWMGAELESRELMAMCLKSVRGLKQVRLVDASWVWTEPHSMRLKVKITIQKEVMHGAVLQQSTIVTFVVRNRQSPDIVEAFRSGVWKAVVQARQRVTHKRTFFYLEQLILKHQAHQYCTSIEALPDGMDFYFPARNQAIRFLEFMNSVIPIRSKSAKKLISSDIKSNTQNYKFTYMADIAPLCKDDLIVLPFELAKKCGDRAGLQLVEKISTAIHCVDPFTLQRTEIDSVKYWRDHESTKSHAGGFEILSTNKQMIEFVVLSVEPVVDEKIAGRRMARGGRGIIKLADVEVARSSDLGQNDLRLTTRTHLGHLLKAGDLVLGYDVMNSSYAGTALDELKGKELPDIILVRKRFAASKNRKWKLQALETTEAESNRKVDANQVEQDYEDFLCEVETDKDLRSQINLFKSLSVGGAEEPAAGGAADGMADEEEDDEGLEAHPDAVDINELLDEMALGLDDLAPTQDGEEKQEEEQ